MSDSGKLTSTDRGFGLKESFFRMCFVQNHEPQIWISVSAAEMSH